MPASGTIRSPWSGGDLAASADHLQFRRKTAAGFASENPLLWPGEPAWEIDDKKGKIGDGLLRYNSLPYSFGAIGGGSISIPSKTILGNKTLTTGNATGLTPADARDVMDVPAKTGDYTPFKAAAEAHIAAGTKATPTVTGTSTLGSATVVTAALPAEVVVGMPVIGPGIPPYSWVGSIAVNRLSFTISSSYLSNVAAVAVTGAGAGTFSFPYRYDLAHGLNINNLWNPNPVNQIILGWSSNIGMPAGDPGADRWSLQWYLGKLQAKSHEYPTIQQLFPLTEYTPIASDVYVPVPSAFQTWPSFPTTTPTEMFASSRYKLHMTLDGATQCRIVIDWLETPATAGSGAKLKPQYLFGSTWTDLCDTGTADLSIDNGQGPKANPTWGTIKATAITAASGQNDTLLVRLVGFAASAAGTPSFGTVRIQRK